MQRRRFLSHTAAGTLAAPLAAALPSGAAAQARPMDVLVVANEFGPNSLDIHTVGANRPSYGVSWVCYDRLMTYGKKKLPDGRVVYDRDKLEPELAESWQMAPDGNSVTFKLRKNAKFHDGTPVTAKDVKWSFDRAVTVGGFPTFQMAAGSLEKPEQFEVVDEHTFRVKFIRRDKLSMPDLAVPVPSIFNSELVKKNATPQDPWGLLWTRNNVAGGGAFKVESWRSGQEIVYVRNDDWKSGPLPKLRRIVQRDVPNAGNRRALLLKGDIDITFDLPPKDFSELAAEGAAVKVSSMPIENAMFYLGMNVTKPPFDNPKVRQAVAWALPCDKMFDNAIYKRANKLRRRRPGRHPGGTFRPPRAAARDPDGVPGPDRQPEPALHRARQHRRAAAPAGRAGWHRAGAAGAAGRCASRPARRAAGALSAPAVGRAEGAGGHRPGAGGAAQAADPG